MKPRTDPVPRFWSHVDVRGPDECWPWTGGVAGKGYGQFNPIKGQPTGAHRFAWQLEHGPIPAGLHVCHHCDNPPCCNPAHLFVGTPADNMRDKSDKGRNPGNRTTNGRPQFIVRGDNLVAARQMLALGLTQRDVARRFGCSPAAVCRALKRADHLGGEP